MTNTNFIERIQRLPVPILPTMVGAATLSNVFNGMGYTWIRNITMVVTTIIVLLYMIKMVKYPDVCLKEYSNTVPASLYAGFSMLLMILGNFYYQHVEILGTLLLYAGIILHIAHIVIFTKRNVLDKRVIDTFVPSWFVTYNGLLVSCVVGVGIVHELLLQIITYYGIIIYIILIPLMVYRLFSYEIKDAMYHTQAIVLAPCSLCVVAYLNTVENVNGMILNILYLCVVVSLAFVLLKLPKFFSYPFSPAFAGLTFPMAIGIVASSKMAGYALSSLDMDLGNFALQVSGIQLYITTGIITFVLFNFTKMIRKTN